MKKKKNVIEIKIKSIDLKSFRMVNSTINRKKWFSCSQIEKIFNEKKKKSLKETKWWWNIEFLLLFKSFAETTLMYNVCGIGHKFFFFFISKIASSSFFNEKCSTLTISFENHNIICTTTCLVQQNFNSIFSFFFFNFRFQQWKNSQNLSFLFFRIQEFV